MGCSAPQTSTAEATADLAGDEDEPFEGCPIAMREAAKQAEAEGVKPVTVNADGILPLENLQLTAGSFPSGSNNDAACTSGVGLTGKYEKDYEAVSAACGTGTGMKEFVRRASGLLNAEHKRDTYAFKMLGGYCYRFFVVGEPTLSQMNVYVNRPNGSLLSLISTKQSVALLDPKEPWCKKHDREFHIVVEAKGGAAGQYTFGIWARPKK